MVPHREPPPIAARALPPHRISLWPFVYEPTHKIRSGAYPFADLIQIVDPVTDVHRLMNPCAGRPLNRGLGPRVHGHIPRLYQ
jgi:hypothetical protein